MLCTLLNLNSVNCNFILHATKHTKSEVKLFEAFLSESECSLMIICIVCFINKSDI